MPWGGLFTDLEFAAVMCVVMLCMMLRGIWLERRKRLSRIVALCDRCRHPITASEGWYKIMIADDEDQSCRTFDVCQSCIRMRNYADDFFRDSDGVR